MKLLVMTGKLVPDIGNNVKLLGAVLPFLLEKHEVQILSETNCQRTDHSLLQQIFGVPVTWACHDRDTIKKRVFFPLSASLADRNVCSDAIQVLFAQEQAKNLRKSYPFDAILSTMEPYYAPLAAAKTPHVKRVLYIFDPPIAFVNDIATPYRTRNMEKILSGHDVIITTPFIYQSFMDHGYTRYDSKFVSVGFPMIKEHGVTARRQSDGKIRLLFCGWLCSGIRSPKYFLDILSRLDERFVVTFMGRECEKLTERFEVQTKAELITLPQQPYETALQAMADADVMINIGNSVPVHMPSKTLEYINTGKPFVNFYKMDDCPTLYYTKRYPLCLNLPERDPNVDAAAARFIEFCVQSKGKTVDRAYIETEYANCTPEYIAQKILEALGE